MDTCAAISIVVPDLTLAEGREIQCSSQGLLAVSLEFSLSLIHLPEQGRERKCFSSIISFKYLYALFQSDMRLVTYFGIQLSRTSVGVDNLQERIFEKSVFVFSVRSVCLHKKLSKREERNYNKEKEEFRVAFKTRTDLEFLDDGFKWKKYGKKKVKSSPNPSFMFDRIWKHNVISRVLNEPLRTLIEVVSVVAVGSGVGLWSNRVTTSSIRWSVAELTEEVGPSHRSLLFGRFYVGLVLCSPQRGCSSTRKDVGGVDLVDCVVVAVVVDLEPLGGGDGGGGSGRWEKELKTRVSIGGVEEEEAEAEAETQVDGAAVADDGHGRREWPQFSALSFWFVALLDLCVVGSDLCVDSGGRALCLLDQGSLERCRDLRLQLRATLQPAATGPGSDAVTRPSTIQGFGPAAATPRVRPHSSSPLNWKNRTLIPPDKGELKHIIYKSCRSGLATAPDPGIGLSHVAWPPSTKSASPLVFLSTDGHLPSATDPRNLLGESDCSEEITVVCGEDGGGGQWWWQSEAMTGKGRKTSPFYWGDNILFREEETMFWRERERESKEQQNGGPPVGQVCKDMKVILACFLFSHVLGQLASESCDHIFSLFRSVVLMADGGVGKTSLVHLIMKGSSIARPPQTVGCAVDVKHTTYGNSGSSSSSIRGDSERDFFVELWDISGHERYKDCRSLFYSQINGVMFVHDLSQRRTKTSLQKWAAEIAATGTFSAPLANGGPGGLPVPYIVIGNKADIASKEGTRGSSGNLVDVARQWVEKQGLLPSSEEIPLTESFPSGGGLLAVSLGLEYKAHSYWHIDDLTCILRFYVANCKFMNFKLKGLILVNFKRNSILYLYPVVLLLNEYLLSIQAAKEARYDKEAVMKFFRMLIRRRYFSDDLPGAGPWSAHVNRPLTQSSEITSDDDHLYKSSSAFSPLGSNTERLVAGVGHRKPNDQSGPPNPQPMAGRVGQAFFRPASQSAPPRLAIWRALVGYGPARPTSPF
ncbi:Ras-related small GTP-binding family protein [Striga asiatica]|uniref:Ras-related small GTP-binding family protein n=1 Tax=Striga asiatica TaxID=4170 RepID=A0A5A7PQU4_STRAF|nr:Ras-related small GTP-binding family protein [Striga asiatica]